MSMVQGLRIEDAAKLQELLMADQRLLARVGALLQQRLAVTSAVLAEWPKMEGLRDLLMDRALGTISEENSPELLASHCGEQSGLMIITAEDDWRVLAFDDEIDNPLLAGMPGTQAHEADSHDALHLALPQYLHPAVDSLLAASSDTERTAAVEQLRYQKPPLEALRHLMPLFLGDGSEHVREAARRLLTESGAQPSVYRLLAFFSEPDERQLKILQEELGAVDQPHAEICIAILRAALDQKSSVNDILRLSQCIPLQLARSDQLPTLLGALLHHGNALSLLGLVRGMQAQTDTSQVEAYLESLFGASREMDGRLIALLTPPGHQLSPELINRSIDLLTSLEPEPVDRMPIATALLQAANSEHIFATFVDACVDRVHPLDSASIWLLGEWAREKRFSESQSHQLHQLLLRTCEQGDGPQINTLLEQRIPALLYKNSDLAGSFIAVLGELASRTRASRNLDLIQTQITELAIGQADACWHLIEEHPHGGARQMGLQALPCAIISDESAALTNHINRLLIVLHKRSSDKQLAGREEAALVASTAARISMHIPPSEGTTAIDDLDQAASNLGPYGWQALGILAASHHCTPNRRSALIDLFLRNCLGEVTDRGTKEVENGDNTTFIFDQSLSAHTHFVPDLLHALDGLCRSEFTPKPLLKHIIERLSSHFLAVSKWEIVWAPGNINQLAKLLSNLAKESLFPTILRRRIVEALSTRLSQPEMAKMLGEVLAADLDGELSAHAARTLEQIITYHAQNQYLDDERAELCAALIAYLRIPDYGDNDQQLRNRLATTLSSLKRHINKTLQESLAQIIVESSSEVQQRLAWVHGTI